jgi:hypothetical protein
MHRFDVRVNLDSRHMTRAQTWVLVVAVAIAIAVPALVVLLVLAF